MGNDDHESDEDSLEDRWRNGSHDADDGSDADAAADGDVGDVDGDAADSSDEDSLLGMWSRQGGHDYADADDGGDGHGKTSETEEVSGRASSLVQYMISGAEEGGRVDLFPSSSASAIVLIPHQWLKRGAGGLLIVC